MLNFPRWKVWGISLSACSACCWRCRASCPRRLSSSCRLGAGDPRSISASTSPAAAICCSRRETGDVAQQRLEAIEDTMRREMRRAAHPDRRGLDRATASSSFARPRSRPGSARRAQTRPRPDPAVGFGGQRDWDGRVDDGNRIVHAPDPGRASTPPSTRRWTSPARSSTAASTRSARSSRPSSARAATASSSRCPACRIPKRSRR